MRVFRERRVGLRPKTSRHPSAVTRHSPEPSAPIQRKCACGGGCPRCRAENDSVPSSLPPAQQAENQSANVSPAPSEPELVAQATSDATDLMRQSLARLIHLRDVLIAGGAVSDDIYEDEDAIALLAIETWMHQDLQRDGRDRVVFWLGQAISAIDSNLKLDTKPRIRPSFICQGNEFARAGIADPRRIINYCNAFFTNGPLCRRDVTVHERFHLLGLSEHELGKTPLGATRSVQTLVEIVRDTGGESDGNCAARR